MDNFAFYLAGGITQVLDSIPWVRCASGNVFPKNLFWKQNPKLIFFVFLTSGDDDYDDKANGEATRIFVTGRGGGIVYSSCWMKQLFIWIHSTISYIVN